MTATARAIRSSADRAAALPACLTGEASVRMLVELAHDLRSPLTAILTLTESLREGRSGPLTPSQRRQLALIHASALRLCGTTSDTLELARGTAGQDPAPSCFTLREVLAEVRKTVLPMAEEKGLAIEIAAPARERRVGNVQALRRVLLNLATNGLKVTSAGAIRLTAEATSGDHVTFVVRDTGPGMDPATLTSLWDPFRPMPTGSQAVFSSAGLGLAICRKLVTQLGGVLGVTTRLGAGSRFYFEIPLPMAS